MNQKQESLVREQRATSVKRWLQELEQKQKQENLEREQREEQQQEHELMNQKQESLVREQRATSVKRWLQELEQKQKQQKRVENRNLKAKALLRAARAARALGRDLKAKALSRQLAPKEIIAFDGAARNWNKEGVCVSTAKGASGQFTAFVKQCNEVYKVCDIALILRKRLYHDITLNELGRDDVQYMKIYKIVESRLRQKVVAHRNFDKQTYTQRSSPEEALQKAYKVLMKCGCTHEKAMQIVRKGIEDWDDFVHPVDVK